jgi:hypothetical protein
LQEASYGILRALAMPLQRRSSTLHEEPREFVIMIHHRSHWIAVAAIAALALIAFEASGQVQMSSGAAAMYEGRPALAGAQGGQGAQAGLPQGGIGVQGNEAAERRLRSPRVIEEIREAKERERERDRDVMASTEVDPTLLPLVRVQ